MSEDKPARAKARPCAQAEEGEPVAKVVRKGFSTGSISWTKFGQDADLPDETLLYAHPSSPPAADEDRVRKLETVADLADELINRGGLVNRGVDRGLVVVEKADRSDPHYRLCLALAALKSTAAKEQDQ